MKWTEPESYGEYSSDGRSEKLGMTNHVKKFEHFLDNISLKLVKQI